METNNVCNDHLVPIGWGGELNGCPVCFLEGKVDAQAEQIAALKEKVSKLQGINKLMETYHRKENNGDG